MTALDQRYRDELMMALHLHEVPGARIGDILAEVEAHVSETGEDPRAAFGSPKEYAAKITEESGAGSATRSSLQSAMGTVITGALAYVGTISLLRGLQADRSTVALTLVDVVSALLFLSLVAVAVFLSVRAATAVKEGRRYGRPALVVMAMAIAVIVVGGMLNDDAAALITVPHVAVIALGVATIGAAVVVLVRTFRRSRVIDPR